MKLDKHIAYRFLTDDTMAIELMDSMYPEDLQLFEKESGLTEEEESRKASLAHFYNMVCKDDQKAYWITNSVLDQLDSLKVKKKFTEGIGEHYDWTFFKNLPDQKVTFILPENNVLRLLITEEMLYFTNLSFKLNKGSKDYGQAYWIIFYVNRETGEMCEHFNSDDVKNIERFVYALMAFFYLTDNEFKVLEPKQKYGTRKSGKIINSLPIPLTIVNKNWNTTLIRAGEFQVSGHYALRWTGKGRKTPKVIYIEPYMKKGYIRKSGKLQNI